MKKKLKTAIIGGGLTGLSAAFHLKKAGREFLLFEKEEEPGGLAKSYNAGKFSFDYTGHYLHFKTKYGKRFVMRLLKDGLLAVKRKAAVSIGLSENNVPYPFQVNFRFLQNKNTIKECEEGLKNRKKKDIASCFSFKEWMLSSVGEGITRQFMLPYNEKLYCTSANKMLPAGPSTYVPDISKKKGKYGYNACFYYPKQGGIGTLAKVLATRVFDRLMLSSPVNGIDPKKKIIYYGRGKKASGFKKIISTLPLPEIIPLIKNIPKDVLSAAKQLKYVSVFALNLGIGRPGLNKNHWIYFSSNKTVFYRVGFYSSVSKKLCPPFTSSLYAEVSIKKGKKFNTEKITEQIKKDLVKTGILKKYDSILAEQPFFIKYAYVVFDHAYYKNMAIIKKYLRVQGIISTGRYGAWNYSAMEDALLCGREAAKQSTKY